MEKDKKKTLTISSNLKKKIDTSSITSLGKKSFAVDKKKSFKHNKKINKSYQATNISTDTKKKNFASKKSKKFQGLKFLPRISYCWKYEET